MHMVHTWRPAGLALVALLGMAVGCGDTRPEGAVDEQALAPPGDVVHVVASLYPLADVARQIGGESVTVETLLPPGVTPHGFNPTPRAMVDLGGADVVLVAGRGVDAWAVELAARVAPEAEVLTLAAVAEAAGVVESHGDQAPDAESGHDHGHGHDDHAHHGHDHGHDHGHGHFGPNPHLWLDPLAIDTLITPLTELLLARLPEPDAAEVRERAEAFRQDVQAVHEEHQQRLAAVPRQRLVTFHNAFDPLAERYGLKVVAHLTPIELGAGGEVTPARLDAAVRAVASYDVPAVYVEPQFAAAAADRIAERTGIAVLTLDPLGHPELDGRRTWAELMRTNLDTLVDGQTPD